MVAVRGVVAVQLRLRLCLQVLVLQALPRAQSAVPSLSAAACPLGARPRVLLLLLLLALRSVALAAAWSASRPPRRAPPLALRACPLLVRCLLLALAPSLRCLRACRAAPWGACARRIALCLWAALCVALARPSRCFLCCRRSRRFRHRHLLVAASVRVARMCCKSTCACGGLYELIIYLSCFFLLHERQSSWQLLLWCGFLLSLRSIETCL